MPTGLKLLNIIYLVSKHLFGPFEFLFSFFPRSFSCWILPRPISYWMLLPPTSCWILLLPPPSPNIIFLPLPPPTVKFLLPPPLTVIFLLPPPPTMIFLDAELPKLHKATESHTLPPPRPERDASEAVEPVLAPPCPVLPVSFPFPLLLLSISMSVHPTPEINNTSIFCFLWSLWHYPKII